VKQEPERLNELIKLTDGNREVPVIINEGKLIVGFGGS